MSRKFFNHILALVLAAILAGPAVAEDKKQQDSQKDRPAAGAAREAPIAGVQPLEPTVAAKALVLQGWRASKLLGASVFNDQNQRIGKIEDMIVSPDGKVSAAVIEVGGFLGIGSHRVAIPVEKFADIKAQKLVLPGATKEALKALPEFQYA
ncbi:MAG: PRC-barrel domain-containing protein [Burkholderiales bacterium]|nr:PRC-barrel domain-containing protein [Burkholderiales bacterium]